MRAGLALARLHLRRGNVDEAVALAEVVAERNKGSLIAKNLLATARFKSGDGPGAARLFEEVAAANPEFLPARINLAKIDVAQKRPDAARERLMAILKTQPEHLGTLLEVSRLEVSLGNLPAAIEWAAKALSVDTKSIPSVSYLANLHLRAGDSTKALAVAKQAETWAPENPQLLMVLARAYLAANRKGIAAAVLQRLATLANYDSRLLLRVAQLQRRTQALDDAAWSLRKAVDGDPEFLVARVQLVAVLVQLERLEAALDVATALVEKAPDSPDSLGALGEALGAAGRLDEAITMFGEALALSPKDFIAVKYFQALTTRDRKTADEWLMEWVGAHPEHGLAREALAERYLQTGDAQSARVLYEALMAKRPDDPQLLNNYAIVLTDIDAKSAREAAEKAFKLAPNDPYVNDTLGWMLVQGGDVRRGLGMLRNAFSRAGRSPAIRYHIAYALKALGRDGEAQRELEAALKMTGPFRQRADAEALLDTLAN